MPNAEKHVTGAEHGKTYNHCQARKNMCHARGNMQPPEPRERKKLATGPGKPVKTPTNEELLLRKHCCPQCFAVCTHMQHCSRKHVLFSRNKKCFFFRTFSETFCFRNKCCLRAHKKCFPVWNRFVPDWFTDRDANQCNIKMASIAQSKF